MDDNKYFIWAKNDVVDQISGQNNTIEPPTEIKLSGFLFKSTLPRNWFNYILRYITGRLNRPANVNKASLPAAASRGAGYMLYVVDEDGGMLVYSDGNNWRKVHDRTILN